MTSVRLSIGMEQKLESLSKAKHKSKTELIKEALEIYLGKAESEKDSYELGKEYFGQFGSRDGTLSVTYKKRIREKLDAKYNTR